MAQAQQRGAMMSRALSRQWAVQQGGGTIVKATRDFERRSPVRRAAIVAVSAWNLWLTATAEWDVSRTPASRVRGGKVLWRLLARTNTVGPLASCRGRRARGD